MAVDTLIDPSTLPLKEQHRLRAEGVREGTRSLAYLKITDFESAKPTFRPSDLTPRVSLTATEIEADRNAAEARAALVPARSKTKADLLARLNAHRG